MFASHHLAERSCRAARLRGLTLLAAIPLCGAALAAEPQSSSTGQTSATYRSEEYKPATEIDISGPYHAQLLGESYPSTLDIWGPKATLKISIDGQDKPMIGMFLKDQLKVVYKYGAENFNLTTMVEAVHDGCSFNGQYSRLDAALGAKVAPIILTPDWYGGGGGEVKMPLPRKLPDIPGTYGLALSKDGRTINTSAVFQLDNGFIKMAAGGRQYACDYSDSQIFPLYWEGQRMDLFKLTPTPNGFKGMLVKEVDGQQEQFDVNAVKGSGGGGHDHDWTYVFDAIFNNSPPVWIAKLTLHEDEAQLVIDIKDEKATMTGSLVDGILSGTGKYGPTTVSIRAQQNAGGFAGVFRKGSGTAVQQLPVILKNRPGRAAAGPAW